MRSDGADPSGGQSVGAVVVGAGEERRHDDGTVDDYE